MIQWRVLNQLRLMTVKFCMVDLEINSSLEVVDCGEYVDQGEARDQLATTEIDNKLIGKTQPFTSKFKTAIQV